MSKWGAFWDVDFINGTCHIAPCDEEGHILPPHTLDEDCPCKPVRAEQCWVHNDPERGGTNA